MSRNSVRNTVIGTRKFSAVAAFLVLAVAAYAAVQTIPIMISGPNSASGNSNFTATVTVMDPPTSNDAVLVSTDRPDVLHSPSGSWPYTLTVPANATTASFTVTTSSVSSSQSTQLVTCETGKDISNSANWRATKSVTVNP